MANKNVTRVGNTHEKKAICQMIFSVGAFNYEELADAGNFLVGYLPNQAIINDAFLWTSIASDAAAVTVGTTEGGTEILSAGDSTTTDETGTFTGKSGTGTGVPVYVNLAVAPTVGVFSVVIEYIEFTLSTGNLTKVD